MTKLTRLESATLPLTEAKSFPRWISWAVGIALLLPLGISGAWIYGLLVPILWRFIMIDLSYYLLPNIYVILLGFIGLVAAALTPDLSLMASGVGIFSGLFGGLLVNFLIAVLTGHKGGLGGGDIKFLAASGAWVGLGLLPMILWLSFLMMIPFFFMKKRALPFGPALVLAFWITLLFKKSAAGLILSLPLPI